MFVATDIYILSSSITMMALQVPIWRIHLMINLDDPLEIYYISHRWNKRWGRRKRKTKNKAQNWRRWITRWANSFRHDCWERRHRVVLLSTTSRDHFRPPPADAPKLHQKASSRCWASWLHKRRLEREVCSGLFHTNSSSHLESGMKKGIKEHESKAPWTYISSHSLVSVRYVDDYL
jgi:hypothetical protein